LGELKKWANIRLWDSLLRTIDSRKNAHFNPFLDHNVLGLKRLFFTKNEISTYKYISQLLLDILIMLTSGTYYCKISCDGFSKTHGDMRSVYTYLINNEETKQHFTNANNEYKFCTFAHKLPENWDDYDDGGCDNVEFPTKIKFVKHIKRQLCKLGKDAFYDEIKVILPINDVELKDELNLTNVIPYSEYGCYWDDTEFIGYNYPINKK
jgi:hypothetical protein